MPPHSAIDALRRIAVSAQSLAGHLPTSPPTHALKDESVLSSKSGEVQLPKDLDDFPTPHSLISELSLLGVERSTAERISGMYMAAATRLKANCIAHFHSALLALSAVSRRSSHERRKSQNLLYSAHLAVYTRTLESLMDEIVDKFVVRIQQNDDATSLSTARRRSFTMVAVMLLELAFKRNGHPSRSEKEGLAAKTGLTLAQISNWFQNRRSRVGKNDEEIKKEDEEPRKDSEENKGKVDNAGTQCIAVDKLEDRADSALPSRAHDIAQCSDHSSSSRSAHTPASGQWFQLARPPHAYPSPFPPVCPYDPFPIEADVRRFLTPQFRIAKPGRDRGGSRTDIEELAGLFANLRIDDGSLTRGTTLALTPNSTTTSSPSTRYHHAEHVIGFETMVPCAPLPSLVRSRSSSSSSYAADLRCGDLQSRMGSSTASVDAKIQISSRADGTTSAISSESASSLSPPQATADSAPMPVEVSAPLNTLAEVSRTPAVMVPFPQEDARIRVEEFTDRLPQSPLQHVLRVRRRNCYPLSDHGAFHKSERLSCIPCPYPNRGYSARRKATRPRTSTFNVPVLLVSTHRPSQSSPCPDFLQTKLSSLTPVPPRLTLGSSTVDSEATLSPHLLPVNPRPMPICC